MNQALSTREEFGATETRALTETASGAAAAQAQAAVQARYIMAMRQPRNMDMVRAKLLKECDRPAFANVAEYAVPRGQSQITGPSIRFAEAALRALGNAMPETQTIYDDQSRRIVRVAVTDLEANLTYTRDVTIAKTMERKRLRDGQIALGERTNSFGDKVFIVEATEDDLLMRESALVSKALRTLALRLLPGDLIDEALTRCAETITKGDKSDPEAARKRLLDAFSAVGVTPADLAKYLGHDTANISPAEGKALKGVHTALKEGTTTWAEIMAEQSTNDDKPEEAKTAIPTEDQRAALTARLADLRIKSPAAYADACAKLDVDPASQWTTKAPIGVISDAIKMIEGAKK